MSFLETFEDKVWMTAKARYNASARLKKKHHALTFTISFLSVAQIVLTLCLMVDFCFDLPEKTIMLTAMTTSIMILVIANQSTLGTLLTDSEKLHRFGMKFQGLTEEIALYLKTTNQGDLEVEKGFQNKYAQFLREADINHLKIDVELVRAERKSYNLKWFVVGWIKFKNCVSTYMSSLVYIAVPLALLLGSR